MANAFLDFIAARRTRIMVIGTIVAIAAPALASLIESRAADSTAIERELRAQAPELIGYFEENFPQEFAQMLQQTKAAAARSEDPDAVAAVVMSHLVQLRRTYAPSIGTADDQSQSAMVAAAIALLQSVLDNEGPKVCADYATYGFNTFDGTPLAQKYQEQQTLHTLRMIQAARAGTDNRVKRDAPSDADWLAVSAATTALGATDAELNAVASGSGKDPALCSGLLKLMRAMNTDGDTPGARVRAVYITELAAS